MNFLILAMLALGLIVSCQLPFFDTKSKNVNNNIIICSGEACVGRVLVDKCFEDKSKNKSERCEGDTIK